MRKLSRIAALCTFCFIPLLAHAEDIQDANKLFKQGQHAQALEKVNSILSNRPKDAQARFLKGLISDEQGNTTEAIDIFTALTNDYPDLPEPYNNLAVLYARQGQYDKAKIALEMAIRTHPSYATAHENLGDIYAKMASQAYDRAFQLDKNNTSPQTKLALIGDLFSSPKVRTAKPVTVAATATSASAAAVTATKPIEIATTPVVVAAKPAETKPVEVKPTETKPAETKPVETKPAPNPAEEVMKAAHSWAAAWSAKDSKKYLAHYAPGFKTPNGQSRATWEAVRKDRVTKPKSIKVEIHNAKVTVEDEQHASVSFKQHYQASHLNSYSAKTLAWVKVNGQWLITDERSN